MKTQNIPITWIKAKGLDLDHRICILEAEPHDKWRGFMIGPDSWPQSGPLPSLPMPSPREAFEEFVRVFRA